MTVESHLVPDVAASVVVHPTPGVGDATTIQEGLDLIEVLGGGELFIREGSYSISAPLTLPDVPLKVRGSGIDVTVINLGANAIAAFFMNVNREFTFTDFTVTGTLGTAQAAFDFGAATNGAKCTVVERVSASDIQKFFRVNASGFAFVKLVLADHIWSGVDASGLHWDGPGFADLTEFFTFSTAAGALSGGFAGSPTIIASLCDFSVFGGGAVGTLNGVRVSFADGSLTSASEFLLSQGIFLTVGAGVPTRWVELTGTEKWSITQTKFPTGTTEAVRTTRTGGTFADNFDTATVTEAGGANGNRYANNEGFGGSTLIGANSFVDGESITTTAIDVTLNANLHKTLNVDASGAPRTITLPLAATAKHQVFIVKKIDATGNSVTIDGNGAETIDGAATVVISVQYQSFTVQSDGTQWWIL